MTHTIITYQVITGNYSWSNHQRQHHGIITYQVITGNYSFVIIQNKLIHNYNIPSNNRELQHMHRMSPIYSNYNIPSNNRELQLSCFFTFKNQIITYQVITGNYSRYRWFIKMDIIITYQVITGNYSYTHDKSSENLL